MRCSYARLALGFLLSVLIAGASAAVSTVVPNAYTSAPGNSQNRIPFFISEGMRYQQVFAASQFSGAMPISQLALRNANFDAQPFTDTIASVEISLSTVAANPDQLSTTFANNIGADNTEVYDGTLTLSSTNAAGPGNTHVFDVLITFQRTFYYDPSQGNLLLEVKNNSGTSRQSYFFDGIFFDAVNVVGDSVSRVIGPEFNPNATATSGTADSLGLIIRFDSVPEPSSLCLTGLGVALFAWRRRNLRIHPV